MTEELAGEAGDCSVALRGRLGRSTSPLGVLPTPQTSLAVTKPSGRPRPRGVYNLPDPRASALAAEGTHVKGGVKSPGRTRAWGVRRPGVVWGWAGCWDREGTWTGSNGVGSYGARFWVLAFLFNRSWEALLWDAMVVPQCHLLSLVSVSPPHVARSQGAHTPVLCLLSLDKSQEIGKWPKLASLSRSPQ